MAALGAGFDLLQSSGNSKIDGLVVAHLKVQKTMIFDTAPVATKQGIAANKV